MLKLEGTAGNASLTDKFGIVVTGSDAGTLQLLLVPQSPNISIEMVQLPTADV